MLKKFSILLLLLCLSGCSTKFVYKNLDWLVHWYLDDYVELNDSQEEQFDEMLERWLIWHKKTELPIYEQQLNDIISDVKNGEINQEKIALHRERIRQHWVRARTHVAPDLVTLGTTLSDEQIDEFFDNLEEQNKEEEEELEELLEMSAQKRVKKWNKSNERAMKEWIGSLSKAQKQTIASYYERFEGTGKHWIAYRREYQTQLRQTFALPDRGQEFSDKLYDLIVDPEKYRSEEMQAVIDANSEATGNYLTELYQSTSEKQKKRLLREIGDLRDDVQDMRKP